jgi:hypothetical protein
MHGFLLCYSPVVVVVVVDLGVRVHSKGPMRESTTGRKINPCPAPNVTKPMNALNIVVKISLVLTEGKREHTQKRG